MNYSEQPECQQPSQGGTGETDTNKQPLRRTSCSARLRAAPALGSTSVHDGRNSGQFARKLVLGFVKQTGKRG